MKLEVIKECTLLSDQGKITFPEAVSKLFEAGIELYYADLLGETKTYYAQNEAYTMMASSTLPKEVSPDFHCTKLVQAIRKIQSEKIQYKEFLKEIMEAGILSYMVFIKGKKADLLWQKRRTTY